ncbi:MAG TPA: hypothetical protein VKW04_12395 [Planctomycetota bacterium]|nr:hypothetical protein [Planctomycetota bacterium]
MASARKESVLGWVRPVRSTEDTVLYEYRTPRRALRGAGYLALAAGLIGFGFKLGVDRANLLVWLLAILPLVLSAVFASWGLLDLITRGLFELEIDRRARTLALAMPTERGQALAKVGFADVTSVALVERRPLPGTRGRVRWSVLLAMQDGRRIGLGLLEEAAEAERLASAFGELLGVGVSRSVHETRE